MPCLLALKRGHKLVPRTLATGGGGSRFSKSSARYVKLNSPNWSTVGRCVDIANSRQSQPSYGNRAGQDGSALSHPASQLNCTFFRPYTCILFNSPSRREQSRYTPIYTLIRLTDDENLMNVRKPLGHAAASWNVVTAAMATP